MKKFLNTILATAAVAAVTSAAFADAGSKVAHGAYVGASAGMANSNVKYNMVTGGTFNNQSNGGSSTLTTFQQVNNSNAGKAAGLFGVVAGYNFQSGSIVFGGEIYGGLDTAKLSVSDTTASGQNMATWSVNVKRKSFMGFAPRLGYMIAPNTLMYARLGVETGKWKASVNPNTSAIATSEAAWNAEFTTDITPAQLAASQQVTSVSKGGLGFAPGLGLEVYMGKAFVRAQYSYLFGPKITLVQDTAGVSGWLINGTTATHTFKTSQHKVELAVGYKF